MENKVIRVLNKEVTNCKTCELFRTVDDDYAGVHILCGYTGLNIRDSYNKNTIDSNCPFSKPLSKEDIESYGFDCMRAELNMNNKHFFFKPWININGDNKTPVRCYMLHWIPEKNNIFIQTTDNVPSVLFNGNIKNKSELKNILQMVGVI